VSEQQKPRVGQQVTLTYQHSEYSAPIPPPELLAGYERALPGCAERIVAMAEKEQSHRHDMQKKELEARLKMMQRGQYFAFGLGAVGMIGGLTLVGMSKPIVGLSAFLLSLGSLVGVYLFNSKLRRETPKVVKEPQSPPATT
jgi:uncharacterized membrane protein